MIERHIRSIYGLEETQAKVMLKKYRKAKIDLQASLLLAPDNTFTEARLTSVLAQTNIMINHLERAVSNDIQMSFDFAFDQSVEDSVSEIREFEKHFMGVSTPVNFDTVLSSTKRENILLNKFQTSIQTYNQQLRNKIQNSLTQGLIQSKTLSQVISDVMLNFSESEWMVHRIVRTEVHGIYNISKMNSFKAIQNKYIPDLKKMLVHPMDDRTAEDSKELASQNPIIDIEKPFIQHYNNKRMVFMAPPNRPNDRAILIPYREVYKQGEAE